MGKYPIELFSLFPHKRKIRIERLLNTIGLIEMRRDLQYFLKQNKLDLNNNRIKKAGTSIALRKNGTVDGKLFLNDSELETQPLHILFHKPKGYIVSRSDPGSKGGDLIFDILPKSYTKRTNPPLVAIGRLDKDTSGLIILTQCGLLVNRLMAPENHVSKIYEIEVKHPFNGNEADIIAGNNNIKTGVTVDDDKDNEGAFNTNAGDGGEFIPNSYTSTIRSGIQLKNRRKIKQESSDNTSSSTLRTATTRDFEQQCKPAEFIQTGPTSGTIKLYEGKYHQIKRMFGALGNRITEIKRTEIGSLTLFIRPITSQEIVNIDKENNDSGIPSILNERKGVSIFRELPVGEHRVLSTKEVKALWDRN